MQQCGWREGWTRRRKRLGEAVRRERSLRTKNSTIYALVEMQERENNFHFQLQPSNGVENV